MSTMLTIDWDYFVTEKSYAGFRVCRDYISYDQVMGY